MDLEGGVCHKCHHEIPNINSNKRCLGLDSLAYYLTRPVLAAAVAAACGPSPALFGLLGATTLHWHTLVVAAEVYNITGHARPADEEADRSATEAGRHRIRTVADRVAAMSADLLPRRRRGRLRYAARGRRW